MKTPSSRTIAPEFPVYWILKLWGGKTAEVAKRFGLGPSYENPHPHEGLCQETYASPQKLMKDLRAKGWKPSEFTDSKYHRFARIEVTADGFNLVRFPSYSAALADHNTRGRKLAS